MPNAGSDLTAEEPRRAYDDGSWLERSRFCPLCGRWVAADEPGHAAVELPARLWIYTNYDCNLSCSYCLVSSSPRAERRGLGLGLVSQLLDEASALGIQSVFFTGGEPFILPDIYGMIAQATPRFVTTVLSNALLIRGKRLEKLRAVNHPRLFVQVSLDDSEPGLHDRYRGPGSWQRALEGIRLLQAAGIQVRIGTTVTPEGLSRIPAVRAFVRDELGIADEHHVVRPLVKRGLAQAGLEMSRAELVPEMTVDVSGVYWHPVGTDADLLVTRQILPLRRAIEEIARLTRADGTAIGQPFR